MEFSPPTMQKDMIAEIQKTATDAANAMQVTTKTINVHGEEINTTTTKPYEQQQFRSHTDWKLRAISASNLHLRTDHLLVNSDNIRETG